jgi:hypothetical protein
MTAVERVLLAALRAGAGPEASAWLDDALASAAGRDSRPLLGAYTRAPLRVGRATLTFTPDQLRELAAAAPGVGFERWTQDDAVRALLLLAHRHGVTGQIFIDVALACFEQGDSREQQSWLRALSLWPEAPSFVEQAIDACRTNIIPVFEALACENPYPAAYFPERNFNQMVLKALFNNIALSRIVGLRTRLNAELTRMARDYAAERTAAGRPVPGDIHLATD